MADLYECRHCGHAGPAGEDHSCPCPHPNETCPEHNDSCRIKTVAGKQIRVRGSGEWTSEDRAAFAEVVAAVERRIRDVEAEPSGACRFSVDGWCETHSTGRGPFYCDRNSWDGGPSISSRVQEFFDSTPEPDESADELIDNLQRDQAERFMRNGGGS